MKVKIIKCSSDTYWYKNEIGKIFNVHPEDKKSIYTFGRYVIKGDNRVIDVDDTKVLK